ncbi:hypothetical protein ACKKBG_A12485 [Auxenochlorella protothecoides x Auxenochlorella symbiontica]
MPRDIHRHSNSSPWRSFLFKLGYIFGSCFGTVPTVTIDAHPIPAKKMPKRPESPVATEAPVQATMSSNPDCPCAPNMILAIRPEMPLAIHPKAALAIHPKTALSTRRALEDSKLTIPLLLEYPKPEDNQPGYPGPLLAYKAGYADGQADVEAQRPDLVQETQRLDQLEYAINTELTAQMIRAAQLAALRAEAADRAAQLKRLTSILDAAAGGAPGAMAMKLNAMLHAEQEAWAAAEKERAREYEEGASDAKPQGRPTAVFECELPSDPKAAEVHPSPTLPRGPGEAVTRTRAACPGSTHLDEDATVPTAYLSHNGTPCATYNMYGGDHGCANMSPQPWVAEGGDWTDTTPGAWTPGASNGWTPTSSYAGCTPQAYMAAGHLETRAPEPAAWQFPTPPDHHSPQPLVWAADLEARPGASVSPGTVHEGGAITASGEELNTHGSLAGSWDDCDASLTPISAAFCAAERSQAAASPTAWPPPQDDLECTGWEHFILTPERPPMASAQQQWHGWSFVTPYPQRLEQDSPMPGQVFEDL